MMPREMMSFSVVYIPMMAPGMAMVAMAKARASPRVSLTMMQMVFFRACADFSGSLSRIPQYLETITDAPMPSPMQKI